MSFIIKKIEQYFREWNEARLVGDNSKMESAVERLRGYYNASVQTGISEGVIENLKNIHGETSFGILAGLIG